MGLVIDPGNLDQIARLVVARQTEIQLSFSQPRDRLPTVPDWFGRSMRRLAPWPFDIGTGLAQGEVAPDQQAVPRRRQPVEFLRVGEFQAIEAGLLPLANVSASL